jgi:hypothetical protein
LPFYEQGQLARYLDHQRTLMCPTDWRLAVAGNSAYRARALKLTTYTMNGAVCGYGGREVANASSGGTYRLGGFTPSSFLLWAVDETSPFNFNDAASNPVNEAEGVSIRHAEEEPGPLRQTDAPTIVGRFGGSAEFIASRTFNDLRESGGTGRSNDLTCGPGYE